MASDLTPRPAGFLTHWKTRALLARSHLQRILESHPLVGRSKLASARLWRSTKPKLAAWGVTPRRLGWAVELLVVGALLIGLWPGSDEAGSEAELPAAVAAAGLAPADEGARSAPGAIDTTDPTTGPGSRTLGGDRDPAPEQDEAGLGTARDEPDDDVDEADEADDEEVEDGADPAEKSRAIRRASRLTSQGGSLLRKGKLAAAKARYQAALQAYRGYPRALYGLAQIAVKEGKAKTAVALARRAVRARPRLAANHLVLGDAYALDGKKKAARSAYLKARRLGSRAAQKRLERL